MLKASINFIKDLKKQKHENSSLLFLDNYKIIKDAISSGLKPLYILLEDEDKFKFNNVNCPIYKVDHKTIQQLADSKTPQGVVCILEYTQNIVEKPKSNFLVLDGLQDPGNVGTLIRTAYAAGFNYVFLIDSVKPTNSKLVRSSVGAIFHTKLFSITRKEFICFAKGNQLSLIATDMEGENIFEFKSKGIVGVVVGNEGQGVSDEIMGLCANRVKIPMQKGIESLNASISGAIIMYQINKDILQFDWHYMFKRIQ